MSPVFMLYRGQCSKKCGKIGDTIIDFSDEFSTAENLDEIITILGSLEVFISSELYNLRNFQKSVDENKEELEILLK